MAAHDAATFDPGLPDVAFALLTLVSVALTVVAQLVWIVLFDATGLDRAVPMELAMVALPGVTVAVLPTLAAHYLYARRTTRAVGVGTAVVGSGIAAYTLQAWAVCGPGC